MVHQQGRKNQSPAGGSHSNRRALAHLELSSSAAPCQVWAWDVLHPPCYLSLTQSPSPGTPQLSVVTLLWVIHSLEIPVSTE